MNAKRRKKKQLRNIVCAAWCGMELLIALLAFLGLGKILQKTIESGEYKSVSGIWGDFALGSPDVGKKKPGLVICLDAGHGGKDNGSDYNQKMEKDDNLRLTLAVAAYLETKDDVTVMLTRGDDTFVSLEDRCSFANQNGVDYFVSMHRNDGDGAGVEVWVDSGADGETMEMAQNILNGLSAVGIQRNRGIKKGTQRSENGDYYVNVNTDMPSCIIELGFIGNATDNQLYDQHLNEYAAAIGDAVLATYEVHKDAHVKDDGDSGSGAAGSGSGTGMSETAGDTGAFGAGGTDQAGTGTAGDAAGTGSPAGSTGMPVAPDISGIVGGSTASQPSRYDSAGVSTVSQTVNGAVSGFSNVRSQIESWKQPPEPEAPAVTMIDPAGKDNTIQDWGQGVNVDEKNRPTGALSAQSQYGGYNALFIGEDTPTIYLTFDEGYECGHTETILNTLKEKDVKAVFFVTMPYVRDDGDLVQRILDDGHVLGNHSVTHPASGLPSQSMEEQQNEVMGVHNYILENYGYTMSLFRYPAGKFSEQSLAVVNNCGYKSVFWSFAYLDYDVNNQPDRTESLNKMIDKLHPGAVYLLHAESETNAAVLGDFIDQARAKGYSFGIIT